MDFGVVNTTLQAVAKLINDVRNNVTNYYTTKSLAEVTKLTRVEPLTIVSKDCVNLEYMPDINQALLNIFCGYYLQTVNMLGAVQSVKVVRLLDRLNPDRDETGFLLSESLSRESYKTMSLENYQYKLPTQSSMALEAKDGPGATGLNEIANLSVGKMLNVEICVPADESTGDSPLTARIPVNVRLMVSSIPNASILNILAYKREDDSLIERYHAWRGGRISFISDLIFCQDLIDEYKRANIKDETGTLQEIVRRVNNAKKYGLLTKNPSLVSASNLFVISEENARELEMKLGGKLSNPKVRQKAFDNTYSMIIVVVDREWERVTFYTRGISAGSDISIKELKTAGKGSNGSEILDFMKSMSQGAPAF